MRLGIWKPRKLADGRTVPYTPVDWSYFDGGHVARIGPTAFALLVLLMRWAGSDARSMPSVAFIEQALGLSRKTVVRAFRILLGCGYIRRDGIDPTDKTAVYTIMPIPVVPAPATPAAAPAVDALPQLFDELVGSSSSGKTPPALVEKLPPPPGKNSTSAGGETPSPPPGKTPPAPTSSKEAEEQERTTAEAGSGEIVVAASAAREENKRPADPDTELIPLTDAGVDLEVADALRRSKGERFLRLRDIALANVRLRPPNQNKAGYLVAAIRDEYALITSSNQPSPEHRQQRVTQAVVDARKRYAEIEARRAAQVARERNAVRSMPTEVVRAWCERKQMALIRRGMDVDIERVILSDRLDELAVGLRRDLLDEIRPAAIPSARGTAQST